MAWLSGYSNRIKLIIDNTNIDDTLTDFPILVKISDSSGITSENLAFFFTEIGSDANRKKIAVTTSDEETQCYVEIENFEYVNNIAWLWVKVPYVDSGSETILYLYYDSTQSDNTSYVGDTTEIPAHNVWNDNFVGVWHMVDATNTVISDSTSNSNNGVKFSVGSPTEIDGKIGKAQGFSSENIFSTEYIAIAGLTGMETTATISMILKPNDVIAPRYICDFSPINNFATILGFQDGYYNTYGGAYPTGNPVDSQLQISGVGVWDELVWVKNGTSLKGYLNAILIVDTIITGGNFVTGSGLKIGSSFDSGNKFDGAICDYRLEDTNRSLAWIKATHYSNWDDLITFDTQTPSGFCDVKIKIINSQINNFDGKVNINDIIFDSLDGIIEICFTPEEIGESIYWDNGSPIMTFVNENILNLTYWKDGEAFGDLAYRKQFKYLDLSVVNGKIYLTDKQINTLDGKNVIKNPIDIVISMDGKIEIKTIPVGLVKILIS